MDRELGQVRALVFEPYTLFRVPPITSGRINVSEHGYRLGGCAAAWPPDPSATNLFVFGGSTTFGYGVSDAETVPAQLRDCLGALAPGIRVSVYNFATPNHFSVQERIRLEQLLLSGHVPRVAIFVDGFDEFIAPYYAPLMLKPFIDAIAARSRRRRITREAGELLGRLLPGFTGGIDERSCRLPDPNQVLDQYASNARMIRAVCSEFRLAPLFVWQPVPCYGYDGEGLHGAGHGSSQPLIDCVRAGYELMSARRAKDFSSRDCLWLADIQRGNSANLYLDADHYTPAFAGEIASHIAGHLVDGRFIG
jgi:hypothetical protein